MKDTLHDDMNELENTASVHENEDDCDCGCHDHDHEEHGHHHEHEHHHHHDDDHCDCGCCDDDDDDNDDDCDCGCHHHDHNHHHHAHHHHHEEVHHVERVHTGNSKIYILQNLGCAHCAAKMEEKINNLPGVTAATITFNQTVTSFCQRSGQIFTGSSENLCFYRIRSKSCFP